MYKIFRHYQAFLYKGIKQKNWNTGQRDFRLPERLLPGPSHVGAEQRARKSKLVLCCEGSTPSIKLSIFESVLLLGLAIIENKNECRL